MNNKKLFRSTTDKKLTGLCGGIGEYFGFDATLIRVGVVIAALVTAIFPALVIYIIVSIIVPEGTNEPQAQDPAQNVDYRFVNNDPNNPDGNNNG